MTSVNLNKHVNGNISHVLNLTFLLYMSGGFVG